MHATDSKMFKFYVMYSKQLRLTLGYIQYGNLQNKKQPESPES